MLRLEIDTVLVGVRAEAKEDAIRQVAGLLVRAGCIEPGYAP
jgi:mannitol/fructose-specific phosphotransferase system IIA component